MRSYSDIARKREAEIQELKERIKKLEAVAEIARIALVELQAIHDDWNMELSVDCVGEHYTTAQTIAKLSAALDGGE